MAARLPKPGGDTGDWGSILNTFLEVAHNSNGSLKGSAVTAAGAGTYSKPSGGIPSSDLSSAVQANLSQAVSAYQKPVGGIPSTDLNSGIQTSLGLANTSAQPGTYIATVSPPSGDTSGATDTAMLTIALSTLGTAGGGWLYLRAGTYYVNAQLNVPSNTRITGAGMWLTTVWQKGVTFNVTGSYYRVFAPISGAANVEFRDFWIKGDNNPVQTLPLGAQCDGIGMAATFNCSDIRVERVGCSYLFGIGIHSEDTGTTNLEVVDCWAVSNGKDGINPNCTGGKVTGCTLIGNAYTGIEITGSNYLIADNYANGNLIDGISMVGPNSSTVQTNIICHDNTCLGNGKTGINCQGNIQQFAIHNNVCRNNSNYGIALTGTTNFPSNGKVHHNTAVSNSSTSFASGAGLFIDGTNIEVDSNYCTDTADAGYSQIFGIQMWASTGGAVTSNNSLGNVSWDYDFNSATSMVLDIKTPGAKTRYRGTNPGITAGRVTGTGTPASVVPAAIGVIYQRTDGAGGTTLYVKETASGPADTSGWTAMQSATGTNPVGSQTEYSKVTGSNVTQALTASTWTLVSGAPSVTLPSDGNAYRIEFSCAGFELGTASAAGVNIALSAAGTTFYAAIDQNFAGGSGSLPYGTENIVAQKVTGSGQTIGLYALCANAYTLTILIGAANIMEMAAYRVA